MLNPNSIKITRMVCFLQLNLIDGGLCLYSHDSFKSVPYPQIPHSVSLAPVTSSLFSLTPLPFCLSLETLESPLHCGESPGVPVLVRFLQRNRTNRVCVCVSRCRHVDIVCIYLYLHLYIDIPIIYLSIY